MKLKTEIVDGTVQDHSDRRDDQWWHLEHDAAAAHALMQALEGIRSEWEPDGPPILSEIANRADAIMAGWGFTDA